MEELEAAVSLHALNALGIAVRSKHNRRLLATSASGNSPSIFRTLCQVLKVCPP